jgi:recombination DNA repair RAD52 pathway protein
MLKSALRYIRQKPKAVRNQYALALSSLFTAIVAFFWLASGSSSLDKAGSTLKAPEGNTPFSNLIKQAKDQFASSKAALTKAEQATSSPATTTVNSNSEEMILSAETLEGVDQTDRSTTTTVSASTTNNNSFSFSGNDTATSAPVMQYIEVQIATSSNASATLDISPQ